MPSSIRIKCNIFVDCTAQSFAITMKSISAAAPTHTHTQTCQTFRNFHRSTTNQTKRNETNQIGYFLYSSMHTHIHTQLISNDRKQKNPILDTICFCLLFIVYCFIICSSLISLSILICCFIFV